MRATASISTSVSGVANEATPIPVGAGRVVPKNERSAGTHSSRWFEKRLNCVAVSCAPAKMGASRSESASESSSATYVNGTDRGMSRMYTKTRAFVGTDA